MEGDGRVQVLVFVRGKRSLPFFFTTQEKKKDKKIKGIHVTANGKGDESLAVEL